nr:hypothetical protein [Anaerolineae bacterium]
MPASMMTKVLFGVALLITALTMGGTIAGTILWILRPWVFLDLGINFTLVGAVTLIGVAAAGLGLSAVAFVSAIH